MTTGVNIVPILVWDNRLPPELFIVYNGGLQNFKRGLHLAHIPVTTSLD